MTHEELNRRFSKHQNTPVTVSKLIPSYIVDVEFSDVSIMFEYYKDDLQTDDMNHSQSRIRYLAIYDPRNARR